MLDQLEVAQSQPPANLTAGGTECHAASSSARIVAAPHVASITNKAIAPRSIIIRSAIVMGRHRQLGEAISRGTPAPSIVIGG